MAVGAVEARFYAELLDKLGLADAGLPRQHDPPAGRSCARHSRPRFCSKTRDEWCAIFEGSDACVAPVLGFSEAPGHPQHRARGSFVEVAGVIQPGPAPRFSATPSGVPTPAPTRGEHGGGALRDWGFDATAIERLQGQGLGFRPA